MNSFGILHFAGPRRRGEEIFEKIDGREAKLTGKLSDSYILGYYHQKESFYQKQEEDAEKPEAIAI